jgi:putative tributyrin esterase
VALCQMHYFSRALQKATAANVILPETQVEGPFPVFYLLHGLSDDHSIWQRRTSIERYVQGLPLIVVMPDGGRGFYCDAEEGMAWETALVGDLIPFIDKMLPTVAERSGRCIGGLSMGGYGAVKLALRHPQLFCSANSHSGAMAFAHYPLSADPADAFAVEFTRVIGRNPVGGPNDLFALAKALEPDDRPALSIDCGTEDFLLDANRTFHAHLDSIGYAHDYREFAGGHVWSYWDEHVQEALQFHLKSIALPKAPAATESRLP